jgi:hypothetical protein
MLQLSLKYFLFFQFAAQHHPTSRGSKMGKSQHGLFALGQGSEPGVQDPRRLDPASLRSPLRPRERGRHDAPERSSHFRQDQERVGALAHGQPRRPRRCSQVSSGNERILQLKVEFYLDYFYKLFAIQASFRVEKNYDSQIARLIC